MRTGHRPSPRGVGADGAGIGIRGIGGASPNHYSFGITVAFSSALVRGNVVHRLSSAHTNSTGISTHSASSRCEGNLVLDFNTAFIGCTQP